MGSYDRISGLHDSILSHILSFLTTKEAAATSILSKRWRFLWTKVPLVDLDDDGVCDDDPEKIIRYQELVTTVLLLNKECLQLCRLSIPYDIESRHAKVWILAIVTRNVKEIELIFSYNLALPSCLFTCEKLVVLTLRGGCDFHGPGGTSVHLPNLRVIKLIRMKIVDGGGLCLLTSACPALEELVVDYCVVSIPDVPQALLVYSHTLKKLHMTENTQIDGASMFVFIHAPSLEYLMVSDILPSSFNRPYLYYATDLSGIREADIHIPIHCYDLDDPLIRNNNLNLMNSFAGLSMLRLRRTRFQVVPHFIYHCLPVFNYLTCLELEIYESCRCIVPAIIKRTPNLVHLIVACAPIDALSKSKCSHATDVPSCLLSSIKVIEIRDFNNSEEAVEMVSFLLINARVLGKMKIYCVDMPSPMEEMKILRKFCCIPRGSGTCRISICSSSCNCGSC